MCIRDRCINYSSNHYNNTLQYTLIQYRVFLNRKKVIDRILELVNSMVCLTVVFVYMAQTKTITTSHELESDSYCTSCWGFVMLIFGLLGAGAAGIIITEVRYYIIFWRVANHWLLLFWSGPDRIKLPVNNPRNLWNYRTNACLTFTKLAEFSRLAPCLSAMAFVIWRPILYENLWLKILKSKSVHNCLIYAIVYTFLHFFT